ncbi:MAG: hypothetical protein K0S98_1111 [Propionibacteriaceae bacterium]|jgi:hypothetical protein|nr:hypothetical protein [Propionibacteriaceae bacterium]
MCRQRMTSTETASPALEETPADRLAGHPSGGSHTASASESVSAANTRSGGALMTRTAVSVRLIAGAPEALVDHARADPPPLTPSNLC